MAEKPDLIIIGGGPNGLTAGAYLSQAGLKVLVMDCNQELGGGLASEMVTFPGFLTNTHAIYHMMVDLAPPFKDFDFEGKYLTKYVWPDLQWTMLFADGKSLCVYRDVEKTCQSIAAFSQKDADSYRKLNKKIKEYMENFTGPLTYMPAAGALEIIPVFQKSEMGREYYEMSEMSSQQIIEEYFENDRVKALMYYMACHWGLEYDATGTGFLAMLYLERATNYRLAVGGSHKLASSFQKIILENGGRLLGSQWIKKIIVSDGVAKGVELEDGTVIEANKGVISTIDLDTTFLKYVGENNLEKDFAEGVKRWQWEKWSLLQIHLAMQEAPKFKAAETNPDINNSLIHVLGYETSQDVINHWKGIGNGELPTKGFITSFPSVHDPSQAPPGQATGLISQMVPYDIKEGADKWERYKFKQKLIEERVEILQQYAPNINKEKILAGYAVTPVGTEKRFPNMVRGSYKQGAYNALQLGYNRPNATCSNHRTPIKNLWLGGANTYAGGCVIFSPGYLTANAVVDDLGIERWWPEPESVTKAREKGML